MNFITILKWMSLLLSASLMAQTTVSGFISGQTWTATNSPYIVQGNLTVNSLDIEPGVEVRFAGNYVMEVAGILTAIGTSEETITFKRDNSGVGWQGLYFNNSMPGCEMRFLTIEGAVNSAMRVVNARPVVRDCTFRNSSATHGGGVNLKNLDYMSFINCVFSGNTVANHGGGMYVDASVNTLFLENCIFSNNNSTHAFGMGGGLYLQNIDATIRKTNFNGNSIIGSTSNGSNQKKGGGGLYISGGSINVTRSQFMNNNVYTRFNGSNCDNNIIAGGSIFIESASATIHATSIKNSESKVFAHKTGSTYDYNATNDKSYGGGLYIQNSTVNLSNSIVAGNHVAIASNSHSTTRRSGSGIYVASGTTMINNSVVANNTHQGLVSATGSNVSAKSSIFYFNSTAQISGTTSVIYSNIENGYSGSGNISQNPIFEDETDYRLNELSPCIDMGSPLAEFNDGCLPPGWEGDRSDMGAYGGPGNCEWTLTPGLDPPDAVDDTFSVDVQISTDLDVFANDLNLSGLPLSIADISQGSKGTVSISADAQSVTYISHAEESGIDTFTYTLSDGFGNFDTATVTVGIGEDPNGGTNDPTTGDIVLSLPDIISVPGEPLAVPVKVTNFNSVRGFQFSMHWDPTVLEYVDIQNSAFADLTVDDFNITSAADGDIAVVWLDDTQVGQSLANGETLFAVQFNIVGVLGQSSPLTINGNPVPLLAIDAANQELSIGAQNGSLVLPADASIDGKVTYYADSAKTVADTEITLSLGATGSMTTLEDGLYSFTLAAAQDYRVTATKTVDPSPLGGVNVIDLALIQQHILAMTPFDSPYKILAADADGSDSVSAVDLARLQQYILLITSEVAPDQDPWRMVVSDFTFADPLSPWDYENFRDYVSFFDSVAAQDFVALKVGDVNGDWNPPGARAQRSQYESAGYAVNFYAGRSYFDRRGDLIVPILTKGFRNVQGYQFTLTWDARRMTYKGVQGFGLQSLNETNFGETYARKGALTSLWFDQEGRGRYLPKGSPVFELRFKMAKRGKAGILSTDGSGLVQISDELLPATAFDEAFRTIEVK